MADDAARMRSDGSLAGRPARTGSGTTRGGGGGGLRPATGSAPHYLGTQLVGWRLPCKHFSLVLSLA